MSVIRQNELDEEQNAHVRYAVLLVHEGGPRELSMASIVSYMSERLSEPRLVGQVPRLMWYPILYGFVLPTSYRRVRALYESSWIHPKPTRRPSGSVLVTQIGATPAVHYTNLLAQRLAETITTMITSVSGDEEATVSTPWARRGSSVSQTSVSHHGGAVPPLTYSVQVEVAYTSQRHSVDDALRRFRLHGNYTGVRDTAKRAAMVLDERLIILPLYPQYSSLAIGTAFDAVLRSAYFSRCVCFPHMSFVRSYCDHHAYVHAVQSSVRAFLAQNDAPDLLLVVFDDSPNKYGGGSDSYSAECQRTFMALRDALSGPQLVSTTDSWSSLPAFNDALNANTIVAGFFNATPGRPAAKDVHVILKTASHTAEDLPSSVAISSVTAPVEARRSVIEADDEPAEPLQERLTKLDTRAAADGAGGVGTVYFLFPGISVETAESTVEARQLCEQALKCGWRTAKAIPCLNDSKMHVEMLCSVLSSEM